MEHENNLYSVKREYIFNICKAYLFTDLFISPSINPVIHSHADVEIVLVTVTIAKYSCHPSIHIYKYKSNKQIVKKLH
jgi:hypothetical protein